MKTTSIFLGSKGLSQSEANHTANVSKEIAEAIGSEIQEMSLFRKHLNDKYGKTPYNFVKEVDGLEEKCLEEGAIYALSAWLREGIKSKAQIIAGIQSASADDLGIEKATQPNAPMLNQLPVESQMIEQLNIAERAEYLTVEAKAAHIGKKIHPGGVIAQWRKMLAKTAPVEFIQGEKDHLRIDVERLYTPKSIDDLFYTLQKEHREVESRLNYYKAKLHNLFNEQLGKVQSENASITEAYRTEYAAWRLQFEANQHKAEAKRAELLREASELKVIVPDSLRDILEAVRKFSKK
tara:strand:- start:409 stop:1290 length:882 start_codon:yes stop_codon:yes gene_type:complete